VNVRYCSGMTENHYESENQRKQTSKKKNREWGKVSSGGWGVRGGGGIVGHGRKILKVPSKLESTLERIKIIE